MTWIGPPPLALTMPAELAACEPAGIRRRSAEHRADADAVAAQARALRAAVVRLVPAAWLGLGSLSFAQAALMQATSLEAIADACTELAARLDALAARLEQAQTEARTAVDAARRLDVEVDADNQAWSRRPEPERADPDPSRLAGQDAAARALTGRLAVAVESAQQAWLQAAAAFDLVAYGMPDLATRMHGGGADDWHPSAALAVLPDAERRRLLGVSPVCIGAGWAGGGAVLGPDGRRYPLVVPWVETNGVRETADPDGTAPRTETLDGADPGWHQIGVRIGVDSFGPSASTATKAAIVTAGFVGNAPQMLGRLRPDLLPRLRWSPAGVPDLQPGPVIPPPRVGGTVTAPRPAVLRDGERLRWVPDIPADRGNATRSVARQNLDLPPDRSTPAAPNAMALADSGLAAVDTARRLDGGRPAAYRATFEENDDGRLRARVTLYQVLDTDHGPTVLARDVSVAGDGQLRRDPVVWSEPRDSSPHVDAGP